MTQLVKPDTAPEISEVLVFGFTLACDGEAFSGIKELQEAPVERSTTRSGSSTRTAPLIG